MADKTGIEWTDSTWNPVRGCSRVSEGCRNCYAEGVANRFKGNGQPYEGLIANTGQWNGVIKIADDKQFYMPLRMRRSGRKRIFVNSMSDLFHEHVPTDVIDRVFAVMLRARWHTYQILTKRPQRMLDYMSDPGAWPRVRAAMNGVTWFRDGKPVVLWPPDNVWLGVSVEDQATADERIPLLLQTPAAVRWISVEPLIGAIDLKPFMFVDEHDKIVATDRRDNDVFPELDWVVIGGESGKNARPMHPAWVRSLRDQCEAAYVPLLFKQWGDGKFQTGAERDFFYEAGFNRAMKKGGRMLDGVLHDSYPDSEAQ